MHWFILGKENNTINNNPITSNCSTILIFGGASTSQTSVDLIAIQVGTSLPKLDVSFLIATYWGLLVEYSFQPK
jgi:hypothetical protein